MDEEIPIPLPPVPPSNQSPGTLIAIAMTCGPEWDEHITALRLRSYELAVARGHINRYPS